VDWSFLEFTKSLASLVVLVLVLYIIEDKVRKCWCNFLTLSSIEIEIVTSV